MIDINYGELTDYEIQFLIDELQTEQKYRTALKLSDDAYKEWIAEKVQLILEPGYESPAEGDTVEGIYGGPKIHLRMTGIFIRVDDVSGCYLIERSDGELFYCKSIRPINKDDE